MGNAPGTQGPTGPLPLCIGVTGHRDPRPDDEPRLRAEIARRLEGWLAQAPHTELQVLSALAEGADLLVAEVALELAAAGHPVVLRAVLPMPWAAYAADFEPTARARVEAVLARVPPAHRIEPDPDWLAARLGLAPRGDGQLPDITGTKRVDCYEDVGRRIARHCHLLLALWDGHDQGGRGGTAQIVAERLAGIPVDERPVSAVFRDEDRGPVLVLPTARRQHDDGPRHAAPGFLGERPEEGAAAPGDSPAARALFDARLAEIEAFNRAAVALDDAALAGSRRWLLPGVPRPRDDAATAALEAAYTAADVLAGRHQRRNHQVRQAILALALLIPTLAVVGGLLPSWTGLAYPLLFVGMLALASWNRRRHHHDRSLLYRALAEALRVQMAWRLAGSDERASQHYLRRHQAALDWMGVTLRCLCLQPAPSAQAGEASMRALGQAWIVDQRDYHQGSARRRGERAGELDRFAVGLVALALVISLVLGLLPETALPLLADESRGMLGALAGSLPALAGCLLAYNAAMAHREVARESERMAQLHARAATALDAALAGAPASPPAIDLLHEVGIECLRENAEWVFLHLDRPPEAKLD